jgi:hypothetical protein
MEYIQIWKPDVLADFIAGLTPYALLRIKCWLVRGKIFKMNLGVAFKEKLDSLPSMPGSPVNIEPDKVAL